MYGRGKKLKQSKEEDYYKLKRVISEIIIIWNMKVMVIEIKLYRYMNT